MKNIVQYTIHFVVSWRLRNELVDALFDDILKLKKVLNFIVTPKTAIFLDITHDLDEGVILWQKKHEKATIFVLETLRFGLTLMPVSVSVPKNWNFSFLLRIFQNSNFSGR